MTLPNERARAILRAQAFLLMLINRSRSPGVPGWVRREAYYVSKHFPLSYEVRQLAKASPDILKAEDQYVYYTREIVDAIKRNYLELLKPARHRKKRKARS